MNRLNDGWFAGTDNRQTNRAVNELAASQRALESRFRSSEAKHAEQSKKTEALAARVAALERALQAVIEMENTREELTAFADAAATRRYAKLVVAAAASIDDAASEVSAPPADVDGYWLSPTARAVASWSDGSGGAEDLLARARRLDAHRTNLFVACVAAMSSRPEHALPTLDSLLASTNTVTAHERLIWNAAAAGRFGRAGSATLTAALRRALDASADQAVGRNEDLANRLREVAPAKGSTPIVEAGRRLASLRGWLESVGASSQSPGAAGEETSSAALADELAAAVAGLVDEGAPGEDDVLGRIAEIQQSLAPIGVDATPHDATLDAEMGTVWSLLLDDLTARGADETGRRNVALAVLAPWIDAAVDDLAERARSTPDTEITVEAFGAEIPVTPDGPSTTALRRASAATPYVADPPAWMQPTAIGVAVLAAVLAVVGIIAGPGLIVVAVLAAGVAGLLWYQYTVQVRNNAAEHERYADAERARLDGAAAQLAEQLAEAEEVASEVDDDVAAIRTLLARPR